MKEKVNKSVMGTLRLKYPLNIQMEMVGRVSVLRLQNSQEIFGATDRNLKAIVTFVVL